MNYTLGEPVAALRGGSGYWTVTKEGRLVICHKFFVHPIGMKNGHYEDKFRLFTGAGAKSR